MAGLIFQKKERKKEREVAKYASDIWNLVDLFSNSNHGRESVEVLTFNKQKQKTSNYKLHHLTWQRVEIKKKSLSTHKIQKKRDEVYSKIN